MLIGVGSGIPIVGKVVAIKDYFDKKFNLANGIAFTGGAVAMTIFSPLIELLIATYGWRGAMLIFASINFHICIAGSLLIQSSRRTLNKSSAIGDSQNKQCQESTTENRSRLMSLIHTVSNYFGFSVLTHHPVLIFYLTAMALHQLVNTGWVLFLNLYAISIGFSPQTAAFLSALGGGGNLVGRLAVGPFMDRTRISGRMMFFCFAVGATLTMVCYPFADIYWTLALISFFAGLFLGAATPVFVAIMKEVFHDDSAGFTGAVGLQYMTRGMGMFAGGPITGEDRSGVFSQIF